MHATVSSSTDPQSDSAFRPRRARPPLLTAYLCQVGQERDPPRGGRGSKPGPARLEVAAPEDPRLELVWPEVRLLRGPACIRMRM